MLFFVELCIPCSTLVTPLKAGLVVSVDIHKSFQQSLFGLLIYLYINWFQNHIYWKKI